MAGYTLGFDDGGDVPGDIGPSAGLQPGGIIPTDDASDTQSAPEDDQGSPEQQQPGAPAPADQGSPEQAQPGLPDVGNAPAYNALGAGQDNPAAGKAPMQKLVSYLMGAGAADPQTAKSFEQGVKHENPGISDDDANLLAVHKAGEMGGPGAAWAMVQYNRMGYNAKQSFAKAALNGIDGKTGNAQAAAQAATQAGAHILDGSSTVFTAMPGGQGFTATVKLPGTDRAVNFQLTPQQMNQWLDVGGHGQWDKVMEEGGVATTLQKITSGGDQQPQGDDQQPDASATATPPAVAPPQAPDSQAVRTGKPQVMDPTQADQPAIPGTHDKHGHYIGPQEEDTDQYSPELVSRAKKAFPMIGDEAERQNWMSAQEDKQENRENAVKVAVEKGDREIEKSRVQGQYRDLTATDAGKIKERGTEYTADRKKEGTQYSVDARTKKDIQIAQQKANLVLQQLQAKSRDNDTRNQIAKARLLINDPSQMLREGKVRQPEDILKEFGLGTGGPAASPAPSSPQAAPAQSPAPTQQPTQRPANVPPGSKFDKGNWYTRGPNGEAVLIQ
jgi:hypothetical protein